MFLFWGLLLFFFLFFHRKINIYDEASLPSQKTTRHGFLPCERLVHKKMLYIVFICGKKYYSLRLDIEDTAEAAFSIVKNDAMQMNICTYTFAHIYRNTEKSMVCFKRTVRSTWNQRRYAPVSSKTHWWTASDNKKRKRHGKICCTEKVRTEVIFSVQML